MQHVNVVVAVYQGCPQAVSVHLDREGADAAEKKMRGEYGIEVGAEAESQNAVEVFYNVPVK